MHRDKKNYHCGGQLWGPYVLKEVDQTSRLFGVGPFESLMVPITQVPYPLVAVEVLDKHRIHWCRCSACTVQYCGTGHSRALIALMRRVPWDHTYRAGTHVKSSGLSLR